MKKLLTVLLMAVLLMAVCAVASADSKNIVCPNGHMNYTLIKTTKAAGCESDGEGVYVCNECGEQFTSFIWPLGHTYGDWTPAGAGAHQATCKRCGFTYSTDCSMNHVHAGDEDVAVCSICGQYGDQVLELLTGEITAAVNGALPSGKIIVRYGENPFGDATIGDVTPVAAFTATKQYFGKSRVLNQWDVPALIKVPVTIEDGAKLYQATDAGLLELDYTATGNGISFVTSQFGLFVIGK